MNDGLIARRYAKAFLKYAEEQKTAGQVYGQMKQLGAAYACSAKLKKAVGNKFIQAGDKIKLLLAASGATDSDCLAKFIKLVIDHNREDFMYEMALSYQSLYREAYNITQIEIITASEMPDATLKRITDVVKSRLAGKKVEETHRVDPSLIGGFIVKVDTLQLDASIKNELKKLRLKLLSN